MLRFFHLFPFSGSGIHSWQAQKNARSFDVCDYENGCYRLRFHKMWFQIHHVPNYLVKLPHSAENLIFFHVERKWDKYRAFKAQKRDVLWITQSNCVHCAFQNLNYLFDLMAKKEGSIWIALDFAHSMHSTWKNALNATSIAHRRLTIPFSFVII